MKNKITTRCAPQGSSEHPFRALCSYVSCSWGRAHTFLLVQIRQEIMSVILHTFRGMHSTGLDLLLRKPAQEQTACLVQLSRLKFSQWISSSFIISSKITKETGKKETIKSSPSHL